MIEYSIPDMVSINEAARRTGLSYYFLRDLCLQKKIVFIRSGKKYLINFGKLCDYLNMSEQERENL